MPNPNPSPNPNPDPEANAASARRDLVLARREFDSKISLKEDSLKRSEERSHGLVRVRRSLTLTLTLTLTLC